VHRRNYPAQFPPHLWAYEGPGLPSIRFGCSRVMIYGALSQDLCPQPQRLVGTLYVHGKRQRIWEGYTKIKKQQQPRSHKAKEAKSFMQKSSAFFIQ